MGLKKGPVKKILVVGLSVLGDKVSQDIYRWVLKADLLVGGKRHLAEFPGYKGEKVSIAKDMNSLLSGLETALREGKEIVVLATGDPLLFGIGSTLIKRFGKEKVEVIPAVSSPQAALAKLGLPMEGTIILSKHSRKETDLLQLRYFPKGVILTEGGSGPAKAINEIIHGIIGAQNWSGVVCQAIGTTEELITRGRLEILAGKDYHPNNLVVVENPAPEKMGAGGLNFGRPTDFFDHPAGMITHSELRAVTLSKLELAGAKVMWDLGAGSGSVGIEAALLNPRMKVFAVEKNRERMADIRSNIDRLKVSNLVLKPGNALEICTCLPEPGRIFIGGGGHDLGKLLAISYETLTSGILVVNTVTLDSAEKVRDFVKKRGLPVEAVSVQVSRMKGVAGYQMMKPENPVTVFKIIKNHE